MEKITSLRLISSYPLDTWRRPKTFSWDESSSICVYENTDMMKDLISSRDFSFGWYSESKEMAGSCNLRNLLYEKFEIFKPKFCKIFTCEYDLINRDPEFFLYNPPCSNLPWTPDEDFCLPEKSRVCCMLSSSASITSGHRVRWDTARRLKDSKLVDIYGGIFNSPRIFSNREGPQGYSKRPIYESYCFAVVIENSKYDKYYTEKLTDCFSLGVVPIYWGTDQVSEEFNSRGILKFDLDSFDFSSLSFDLYQSLFPYVEDNFLRVQSLISAEDQLFSSISSILST
jgi:hypothetical protein